MILTIETKFKIGDFVYIKTDRDQVKRMVTAIMISSNGLTYQVSEGVDYSYMFAIELTKNKQYIVE